MQKCQNIGCLEPREEGCNQCARHVEAHRIANRKSYVKKKSTVDELRARLENVDANYVSKAKYEDLRAKYKELHSEYLKLKYLQKNHAS